jgi:hypothetical protein
MGENDNKRSFVIEKNIQGADVFAGTEMPPGILGAPMTLAPHTQDRGIADDRISPECARSAMCLARSASSAL